MTAPTPPALPYTLRQLEVFVAVAEHGTFAAAALALHASDSAVADAVTALEQSLGAPLLHRRRARGVTLTSDGLAALPVARRVLREAEALRAVVGNAESALNGIVRVGAASMIAPVIVPPLIERLGRAHPGITIEFVVEDHPALVTAVERGDLDLCVTFGRNIPAELASTYVCEVETAAVVAASHPLATRQTIRLEELAGEPMVLLESAQSRVHALELMHEAGVVPRIAYRTDDYELCRSLIGRGLGYSLLMRRNTPTTTWGGGEVVFLAIDPNPQNSPMVVLRKGEAGVARVEAVIAEVAAIGSELAIAKRA